MKAKIEVATVTIDAKEAQSILNALNKGLDGQFNRNDSCFGDALKFKDLLDANFINYTEGVHFPRHRE